MKAPRFWQDKDTIQARALTPASHLYEHIVQKRIAQKPDYHAGLPVLCVGNVTMGGSGKTPVVQALVEILAEAGKTPCVLLRGYGGSAKGPLLVDMNAHDAMLVGDEAILHGGLGLTMVARNRADGAREIEKIPGVTHIIMDDGLQNPALHKDMNLLVIDGENPFGNGLVFPAGPLREKVEDAVKRVHGIVIIGEDRFHLQSRYKFLCPVFRAKLKPVQGAHFANMPVIAFAGIGRPEKFFHTLEKLDAVIMQRISFGDHHAFLPEDLYPMLDRAERIGARLVTTRKDWVRLPKDIQPKVTVLDVKIEWEDRAGLAEFLRAKNIV